MRRLFVAVLVLFVLGLTVLALWPSTLIVPDYSAVVVTSGREEAASALQRGAVYEHAEVFDKAEEEYRRAAEGPQDAVFSAAQTALARVLAAKSDIWLQLRASLRMFVVWISENLWRTSLIALLALVGWWLFNWLPRARGYSVRRFNDHTGLAQGETLPALLVQGMVDARETHLHRSPEIDIFSETLTMPSISAMTDLNANAELLQALNSLSVGGIDLPLGQVISAVRQILDRREFIVTGNAFRIGDRLYLSVEVQRARSGAVVERWQLDEAVSDNIAVQLSKMVEHLSFCVLYHVCPGLSAVSAQSFAHFTHGLHHAQSFRATCQPTALEAAKTSLLACLEGDPNYLSARYQLGLVYSMMNDHANASDSFRAIVEDTSAKSDMVAQAAYNWGLTYLNRFQNWTIPHAKRAFQTSLEHASSSQSMLALAHCGLAATDAQRLGREDNATALIPAIDKHLEQAQKLAGTRHDVQAVIQSVQGQVLAAQKSFTEAETAFKAALELQPEYISVYLQLADIYRAQGNLNAAIDWLKRAIGRSPHSQFAYYRLGQVYKDQDDGDSALEAWQNAPSVANAHNEMGKLFAARGEYDQAIEAFRMASKLNKRHSDALCNVAWTLIESGHRDETALLEATMCARRSLNLERDTPQEWHRHAVLGLVYFHRQQLEQAEQELQASIAKNENRLQSRVYMAQVYIAWGKSAEATRLLKDALQHSKEKGQWRDKAAAMLSTLQHEPAAPAQ